MFSYLNSKLIIWQTILCSKEQFSDDIEEKRKCDIFVAEDDQIVPLVFIHSNSKYKIRRFEHMLYMVNTVSDQLTYNTNITNYQIKTLKWMKSKLDRFL